MDNFWNRKDITPPPINKFKCKSLTIDIYNVISLLDKGIESFLIPSALRVESSLMRKVIYRFKLQFRHDNGFKLLEYTNRNLNNLFQFNITKELMYLLDEVPKKYNKELYFPSKQMLEYVLIRLQGFSQVCSQVVETAFKTVISMKARLSVGHQWEIALVIIAMCSRIWLICRHFTTQCCLLYNDLLPLRGKLEIVGTKWLPDNYDFPKDLLVWLDYNWLQDTPDVIVQLPFELPIFSLLDDDDQDVQYTGKYKLNNSTVVIPDSDDDEYEDKFGNVDIVCGINKKAVKLKKKKLKKLQTKPVINIKDSDSDVEIIDHRKIKIPRSASLENLMEILDEQRNGKRKRKREKSTKEEVNTSEIVELDKTNDDIIVLEKISDDECHNNNEKIDPDDIGESVDRNNIPEQEQNIEIVKCIEIKGIEYILDTVKRLEEFLENESFLRKEVDLEKCISSHLSNDDWGYLSYQVKFYLAMTIDNPNNLNIFINKANKLLTEILNDTQPDKRILDEQEYDKMTTAGKRYLINSLDSIQGLQLLLIKENRLREHSPSNCILSYLTNEEWDKLSYDIKCILVMASTKPLRYNSYIRQAKTKMLIKIRNKNEYNSDDYSEDSDIELLASVPRSTIDQLYVGIRSFKKWGALYDYINSLENYRLSESLNIKNKVDKIKEIVKNTYSESPSEEEKKIEMMKILKKKSFNMDRRESFKMYKKSLKKQNDPNLEQKLTELKSDIPEITEDLKDNTVLNNIFESVKAQESYLVPTKKRRPLKGAKKKKLKQETAIKKIDDTPPPPKLTRAQKRKLKAEKKKNAKKIKLEK